MRTPNVLLALITGWILIGWGTVPASAAPVSISEAVTCAMDCIDVFLARCTQFSRRMNVKLTDSGTTGQDLVASVVAIAPASMHGDAINLFTDGASEDSGFLEKPGPMGLIKALVLVWSASGAADYTIEADCRNDALEPRGTAITKETDQ